MFPAPLTGSPDSDGDRVDLEVDSSDATLAYAEIGRECVELDRLRAVEIRDWLDGFIESTVGA